jgi:hypothetical protein
MMKILFSCLSFFLLAISFASAAADDFTVRQQIGSDTQPPTTPSGLTALPVATSQIDLSWTASTDDFGMGGYQVFRDAVQIATTTLTAYSDSGLTASTTYSYYVTAFDNFFNISSSSNIAATTTFALAATTTPPVVEDDNGGNGPDVKLVSLDIVPAVYTADLSWKTDRYAQYELRWGRTSSYELGFVTNELFKREHITTITDLQPGTTYEYQLIAYDRDGDRFVLSEGKFKTSAIPDTVPPTNVSNLTGVIEGNNIKLTWSLPTDPDLSYVRIVRSHLFYPVDPYDGFIAYQDRGELFLDRNAAAKKTTLYYTVFSYDDKGNVSSGAVVAVPPKGSSVATDEIPSNPVVLNFADVEIVQHEKVLINAPMDADAPFSIRIAYEKLPEHLKTITATLSHPERNDLSFTFLLRINKDKSYYEAFIAPLRTSGSYPTVVNVYDHEAQKLYTTSGIITAVGDGTEEESGFLIPLRTSSTGLRDALLWLGSLFLFFLLLWKLLLASRKEENNATILGKGAFLASFAFFLLLSGVGAYVFTSVFANEVPANSSEALSILSGVDGRTLTVLLCLLLATTAVAYGVFFRKKK